MSRIELKSSILKSLKQKGFVEYEKYEYLELTPKGKKVGREINRRHQALRTFLVQILGIDPVVANEEACRIEHGIGAGTLDRLTRFIDFIELRSQASPDFLRSFSEFRSAGAPSQTGNEYPAGGFERRDREPGRPSPGKNESRDAQ